MNSNQLREYIIRSTFKRTGYWSESAEQLLFATAAHESQCGEYVHQISGPALGIYQCEPAPHADIWDNFLRYRDRLRQGVCFFSLYEVNRKPPDDELMVG